MARTFGSSGDKVTISSIAAGDARTYSVWVYQTGLGGSSNGRIFSVRNPSQLQLFTEGGGQWQFQALFGTNNGTWRLDHPSMDSWHHVAVVYDHSSDANAPTIYIDGFEASVSEDGTPSGTSEEATGDHILGNIDTPDRHWEGHLSEWAVWDRSLTADEVKELAGGESPSNIQSADLLYYLPIDGSSPEGDESGNNNDGTVSGTTVASTDPFLLDNGYSLFIPGAIYSWWTVPPSAVDGTTVYGSAVEQAGDSVAYSSDTGRFDLGVFGQDDHQNACLLVPSDDVPLAFYCGHHDDTTLRYRKGTTQGDLSTLGSEQTITAPSPVTYSQVWRDGDDLWFLSRSGLHDWYFWKSTDYGANWDSGTQLIDQASQCYITSVQTGTTVRCATMFHPSVGNQNVWYFEIDLTTGEITEADGTSIGNLDGTNLPLDMTTDLDVAFTASGTDDVRLFAVSDRSSGPEIVVTTWTTDSDGVYRYVEWDGSTWNSESITNSGDIIGFTSAAHYAGGAAFPANTAGGVVYLAIESSGTWTIEVWEDDGGWANLNTVATSTGHVLARPWPVSDDQFLFIAVALYPTTSTGYDEWEGGNTYLADEQALPSSGPDAPTNPAATAQSFQSIEVTWTDVADETGYRVERSDDGSTGWTNVSGTLAADTTSYTDTGLDAETQYFYRVVAFNGDGDSDPSSVVNDTTLAVLVGSW